MSAFYDWDTKSFCRLSSRSSQDCYNSRCALGTLFLYPPTPSHPNPGLLEDMHVLEGRGQQIYINRHCSADFSPTKVGQPFKEPERELPTSTTAYLKKTQGKEEIKQKVIIMEEGGIPGHVPQTVVSMLKIKNECVRVFLAEALCTFSMMVSVLTSSTQSLLLPKIFFKH